MGRHPLEARRLADPVQFETWEEMLRMSTDIGTIIGLLRRGFRLDLHPVERCWMLSTYLEYADGVGQLSREDPRSEIVFEAWKELCHEFDRLFGPQKDPLLMDHKLSNRASSYLMLAHSFEKILWFFDAERSNIEYLRFQKFQGRDSMIAFLRFMCINGWVVHRLTYERGLNEFLHETTEEIYKRFRRARTSFLDIAEKLEFLEFLLVQNPVIKVDARCRRHLRHMILWRVPCPEGFKDHSKTPRDFSPFTEPGKSIICRALYGNPHGLGNVYLRLVYRRYDYAKFLLAERRNKRNKKT